MEPFAGYGGIAGTILGTKDFDISSIYVWCREGANPHEDVAMTETRDAPMA